jgi:GNAT superfamily N-acetyltransferase
VTRAEYSRNYGKGNREWMKSQVGAGKIPGILAYRDEEPVAWCSVAPREDFFTLDRSPTPKRIDDQPVWSIVCFFVSRPYRRQGMMRILIEAAIQYARENGAQAIEAYPITPENVTDARYERYTGVIGSFQSAGFQEIARRSPRRPVMRYRIF